MLIHIIVAEMLGTPFGNELQSRLLHEAKLNYIQQNVIKLGIGQNIATHASPTARHFFPLELVFPHTAL